MEDNKHNKDTKDEEVLDASQNKLLWVVGAVILLVVGLFGLKMLLSPAQDYRVTLIDAPKETTTSGVGTFTWKVDGPPTTIKTTEVFLGQESNPGDLGKEVKPLDTKYTETLKDFADGNYGVPLQFVGNVALSKPGKYYYRVYAQVKDKNYWTDEYTLDVNIPTASVSLVNAPAEVTLGTVGTFTWSVDGPPTTITHTAIYYGLESTPGDLGKGVKASDTKYTNYSKEFADGKYNVPLRFVGNTPKINTAGTYYFRVHAIIDGENFWTEEKTFEVK